MTEAATFHWIAGSGIANGTETNFRDPAVNALVGLGATVAMLLLFGSLIGLLNRSRFSLGWLLAAALLVVIEDGFLTRFWGTIPDFLPQADLNWQGKLLSLAAMLAIAALPAFGWRRIGLTLAQTPGSLRSALPVACLYFAFFLLLAFLFPNGEPDPENIAFQLTMPGLEEEIFYRGLLLFALYKAFTGRVRFLGVDWGWGALLSSLLFGLVHAFGFSDGQFGFDPLIMALTALPAFIAVWVRLRTGSLLIPILMHNFGNSVMNLL